MQGECSLACGNGILDEGEDCDPELYDINPGCSAETCECEEEVLGGYLQQSTSCMIVEGYCNYCGDNRLGGKDEECDDTSDSNCVRCQCSDGYEPSPRTTGTYNIEELPSLACKQNIHLHMHTPICKHAYICVRTTTHTHTHISKHLQAVP